MKLVSLVRASREVSATRARLQKTARLADLLAELGPEEVEIGVYYLCGDLRQGKIGVGWVALRDAAGEAAAEASLELAEVDAAFERVARLSGKGSAAERLALLAGLFRRATAEEQDFLQRLVIGELRQGAEEGVMLDAIARAARVRADDVRRAVMLAGNAAHVAAVALAEGDAGLSRFRLELMRPVQPMLAQTADNAEDALERLGEAFCEHKLDGARVQVHRQGDLVRVFSRRLNEVTEAVPEIVEAVRRLPARELVLDGEAIALRADCTPQPFQVTMRRFGRRLNVTRLRRELPLRVFFFDCLHAAGEDLIGRPMLERAERLDAMLPADIVVPRRLVKSPAEVRSFLDEALGLGHEGLMAKSTVAAYEAGRRGASWLKLKPAHTLDLVVLAVEWGSGRRRGLLSNLHLGARDPKTGGYVMLGKTFKGMTDAMLAWQTERFLELELARNDYTVFVRPEQVVEVAFDGVQESPQYPGGLALRFARVKRYRSDKRAEQADTIDTVRAIFARQVRSAAANDTPS